MKMTTEIAYANMKYHKSKNILTGIAIFLTTLLLFLVPTMGVNMITGNAAIVNELYPIWHALYRGVDEDTVSKLAVHHNVAEYGLRSDAGYMVDSDANIAMVYMDEKGLYLYNIELLTGHLPELENEIVVSEGILKELGQQGEIGDTIRMPYQIYRHGGLDYAEEKEFVISGFLEDGEGAEEQKAYSAFVSKAFLEKELSKEQISYRFLFQVEGSDDMTTDEIEEKVNQLAAQFAIGENAVSMNGEYLNMNYVDPSVVPIVIGIMSIIVLAGMITIYSIYYVSMGERIQEFGKLKAIGATQKQVRQIVLREGMAVACIAIPLGLLLGTILAKAVFLGLIGLYNDENAGMTVLRELLQENKIQLYHGWIYILAIAVTLATVYISLRKPMKTASRVSEIEAMRYQQGRESNGRKQKKGFLNITIRRLAGIYLTGNRKKSLITIISMSATGIFIMVVATILACANPVESANNTILGQYEIAPLVQYGNKEHPEREWGTMQQNNPMTEKLKQEIEQIEGIDSVVCFSKIYAASEVFYGEREGILGVPESYKEELEAGIIEGTVTYEELLTGDKVIVDDNILYWYPDIKIGDVIEVTVENGSSTYEKSLEVAAIGDYSLAFSNFNYLLMAQEGLETLGDYSLNYYYHIFAEENYNEDVYARLASLVGESELLQLATWKEAYEQDKAAVSMVSGACYAFLGVLSVICIMNMMNTMIHSVHVRKKEIGMMQAIGMSDSQLIRMLQIEGLYYTIGTLILSIGIGSILGYPVFLWAKDIGMFNIRNYHYPFNAVILISVALFAVQLILTFALGKSVRKESLINRIRFSE